jgi:hypothetical protein
VAGCCLQWWRVCLIERHSWQHRRLTTQLQQLFCAIACMFMLSCVSSLLRPVLLGVVWSWARFGFSPPGCSAPLSPTLAVPLTLPLLSSPCSPAHPPLPCPSCRSLTTASAWCPATALPTASLTRLTHLCFQAEGLLLPALAVAACDALAELPLLAHLQLQRLQLSPDTARAVGVGVGQVRHSSGGGGQVWRQLAERQQGAACALLSALRRLRHPSHVSCIVPSTMLQPLSATSCTTTETRPNATRPAVPSPSPPPSHQVRRLARLELTGGGPPLAGAELHMFLEGLSLRYAEPPAEGEAGGWPWAGGGKAGRQGLHCYVLF